MGVKVNLFFLLAIFLSLGCSQGVDSVQITRRVARPEAYITTTDTQGSTSTVPAGPTRRLGIHTLGGSNLRTKSTSASYRMTSGIGVD